MTTKEGNPLRKPRYDMLCHDFSRQAAAAVDKFALAAVASGATDMEIAEVIEQELRSVATRDAQDAITEARRAAAKEG
jgi:hypothetical protein